MTDDDRPWFLYVVRCADNTLYTGITLDVARRMAQHNAGRGARYTKTRRPVTLAAAWRFDGDLEAQRAHVAALKAEARFKKLKRARKLRIIMQGDDWGGGIRLVLDEQNWQV